MSKIATELKFGFLSTYNYSGVDVYNSSGLGLGLLMMQNSGITPTDQWAGPLPVGVVRPMEYSTPIPGNYPTPVGFSPNIDWVFLADVSTAAATRRIMKATYNRQLGTFGIDGFITLNLLNSTVHTIRGMSITYDLYTTGSVAVINQYVSGFGTNFSGDGVCIGNRIGFGTTVPSGVNTWFTISGYAGLNNDTGLYLTTPMNNPFSGSYVIEDLRCAIVTTNATLTNGGLYLAKGLSADIFTAAGTTIPSGVSGDNQRAVYWLPDATGALLTNTTAIGCDLEPRTSATGQNFWVVDGITTPRLFKYNLRAPLTVINGRAANASLYPTNTGGILVGTASQANNVQFANANHGPGNGLNCLYFTTTTKVYRTAALGTISSGSNTWLIDNMSEVPAGGASTFAASSLMNSIAYSNGLDRFIIAVNATTIPYKSYITQYKTDGSQFDRNWGVDTRQIDQSLADSTITPIASMSSAPYTIGNYRGQLYIAKVGTTAATNIVYSMPVVADWEYASTTAARLVTPAILTPNCSKYTRVYVNEVEVIGGTTSKNLGLNTEPFRKYFRTAGIDDNTGGWTLLSDFGDLSGISASDKIQFMFEFRTIGTLGIPARLLSMVVMYEDNSTVSNYQPSVVNSDITNKRFAWRFATAFGTTVPTLRVRLYDATSNGLLVDDQTSGSTGTFERSTDGGSTWTAWNNTDLGVSTTTYLRYTPASLGDNIKVLALLTIF